MVTISPLTEEEKGLVEANLDLPSQIAKSFAASEEMREQLEAEGQFTLMRAAKRFDPSRGKFRHYASRWLKGKMINAFNKLKPQGIEKQVDDDGEEISMDRIATHEETPDVLVAAFNERSTTPQANMDRIIALAGLKALEVAAINASPDKIRTQRQQEILAKALEKVRYAAARMDEDILSYERQQARQLVRSFKARAEVITEQDAVEAIELYRQRHDGRSPSSMSGIILDGKLAGRNWNSVNWALYNTETYGLSALKKKYGLENDITEEKILASMEYHKDKTGRYPSIKSGKVLGGPLKGRMWKSIDESLFKGRVPGWPKGSTLASFKDKFKLRNGISEADIVLCMHLHKQNSELGKFPHRDSGHIQWGPLKGRLWQYIDDCFREGRIEGWPKGTTMATFRQSKGLTDKITEHAIMASIASYYIKHGKYPSKDSGKIEGGPLHNRNWFVVNDALKEGKVDGWPKGSSLAKFKKAKKTEIDRKMIDTARQSMLFTKPERLPLYAGLEVA